MNNSNNSIRIFKMPSKKKILYAINSFSKQEWWTFFVLSLIFLISLFGILGKINNSLKVEIPMSGGTLSEGIIGIPRFPNPVLASSEADKDLNALVYSGLVRKNENGEIIPDLANNFVMSEDGLTYTFTLKENLEFHDGEKITADDILFTINSIKDPIIKSPRKGNWDGIELSNPDERTIVFTLKQPYASFLENATIGIMPEHIWNNSPIELNEANTNPVGSGPYQVVKVNKQDSGVIDKVELKSFKNFALGKPFIKKITLHFYQNEEDTLIALKNNSIDQASSISPENVLNLKDRNLKIESAVMPRVFGLFFNQNQNQLFTNKVVVKAIDQAIDKDMIVNEVLGGYGVVIDDPIPPKTVSFNTLSQATNITRAEIVNNVKTSLEKDGWKIGASGFLEKTITNSDKKKVNTILEFTISTGNAPELVETAELVKSFLGAIGMKVDVKTFEIGNLNQSVIRPREYDVLLFGQIINNETDLYAFWHSTQRKDPGLNVAIYANTKVDKILEEAFITSNVDERIKKYASFEEEIKRDMPAVFLYSPKLIYIVSKNLNGFSIENIISPADRFLNAYLWYTKTDKVWKVFAK